MILFQDQLDCILYSIQIKTKLVIPDFFTENDRYVGQWFQRSTGIIPVLNPTLRCGGKEGGLGWLPPSKTLYAKDLVYLLTFYITVIEFINSDLLVQKTNLVIFFITI